MDHLTLLYLSRTRGKIHRPGELPVEFAGDVPLEAAADFPGGLPLGGAARDVGAGAGTAAHPDQRDGVDGAVQRPVTAAVEPVPDGHAAAGRDRAGATQSGERGLAAAPPRARPILARVLRPPGTAPDRVADCMPRLGQAASAAVARFRHVAGKTAACRRIASQVSPT